MKRAASATICEKLGGCAMRPGVWVLGFVVAGLASIFYYQFRTGVPPMPSSTSERRAACALLGELPGAVKIYDLGCGWGGFVRALARQFPDARIVGVELSPLPFLFAKLTAPKNATILLADFMSLPLADADAVVCYLMMAPMLPLARKLSRELREGTPVVSLAFWLRDRRPHKTDGAAALYLWTAENDEEHGGQMHDRINREQ